MKFCIESNAGGFTKELFLHKVRFGFDIYFTRSVLIEVAAEVTWIICLKLNCEHRSAYSCGERAQISPNINSISIALFAPSDQKGKQRVKIYWNGFLKVGYRTPKIYENKIYFISFTTVCTQWFYLKENDMKFPYGFKCKALLFQVDDISVSRHISVDSIFSIFFFLKISTCSL